MLRVPMGNPAAALVRPALVVDDVIAGLAGARRDLTYVAGPVTTGLREVALLTATARTREGLRREEPELFYESVVAPNKRVLCDTAKAARRVVGGQVFDPGTLEMESWTQLDYLHACIRIVEDVATSVVAAPGWEFSSGAAAEVHAALRRGLDVVTLTHGRLARGAVVQRRRAAFLTLISLGWTANAARGYLEPVLPPRPESA